MPRFDAELAARCLHGGGKRAPAALTALATVFGDDTELLLDRVEESRKPREDSNRPQKKDAPAPPAIEEVTPDKIESI